MGKVFFYHNYVASGSEITSDIEIDYYMPSTFYIVKLSYVKLPLALGNIYHWTEPILAQSHDVPIPGPI